MAESAAPKQRALHRRWPRIEKRRIVELTLRPGASTSAIALQHGLNPSSLSHWKRLYRVGKLDAQPTSRDGSSAPSATFVPVSVAPALHGSQPTPSDAVTRSNSVIQLMLASGATLRIETGALDVAVISALFAELRQ